MTAQWRCPYCGHDNRIVFTEAEVNSRPILKYCNNEDGGGNKLVGVRPEVSVVTQVYKIEAV